MRKKKTIYYSDMLHDDFATTVEEDKLKHIPDNFKYINNNIFFKLFGFITYRVLARPLGLLYLKIRFLFKLKNKKCLKGIKTGYFVYGNHVTIVGDALIPNMLAVRKKNYIITGEQANSLRPILPLLKSLGSIPLTDNIKHKKNMIRCIKTRYEEGSSITIYPEAHVWPYYTDIRPYDSESFKYAVKLNAPVVCFTTTFQKRLIRKRPKVTTYIDGPFYPDPNKNTNDNALEIRNKVYEAMKDRSSKYSTYSYFNYVKKED